MLDPAKTGRVKTEIMRAFAACLDGTMTLDDICACVPDFHRSAIRMTLARLVNENVLIRIHMGRYRYKATAGQSV